MVIFQRTFQRKLSEEGEERERVMMMEKSTLNWYACTIYAGLHILLFFYNIIFCYHYRVLRVWCFFPRSIFHAHHQTTLCNFNGIWMDNMQKKKKIQVERVISP